MVGFGVRRRSADGHRIGPLYARSPEVAEQLVLGLARGIEAEPLFLDVPEVNAAATALAEGLGFQPAFETARMYTGVPPRIEAGWLYATSTLELG